MPYMYAYTHHPLQGIPSQVIRTAESVRDELQLL